MGNSPSYSHSSNSGNKNSSDNNGDNNVWKEHREFKQVTLHCKQFYSCRYCQAQVLSPKVQSPKVKTKRTWADTKITWATTPISNAISAYF